MEIIADIWYLPELSARRSYTPYFEVAESESDIEIIKYVDPRVRLIKKT
jgi:hypothetical protein